MAWVFDPFPVLRTERLLLRPLQPQDAAALFAIRADALHYGFINRAPYVQVEQAVESVAFLQAGVQSGRWIFWAFQRHDAAALLGTVCFFNYEEEVQQAELGYELLPAAQGRGYAREAVAAALHYAFGTLQLKTAEAVTQPHNLRSLRLLRQLGFEEVRQFTEPHFSGQGVVTQAVFALARQPDV